MRSLLQCLALCALVSLCVCDGSDSHESTESAEDVFVPQKRANSFIRPPPQRNNIPALGRQRANYYSRASFSRKMKSPAERNAEICEDYSPCRLYAYRNGFRNAYQRYFGPRQPQRWPALSQVRGHSRIYRP